MSDASGEYQIEMPDGTRYAVNIRQTNVLSLGEADESDARALGWLNTEQEQIKAVIERQIKRLMHAPRRIELPTSGGSGASGGWIIIHWVLKGNHATL